MSNAANPASASNPTVVPTASGAHAGARPGTVPPPSRYVDRSSATPKPKAARTTGQPNSSQRPRRDSLRPPGNTAASTAGGRKNHIHPPTSITAATCAPGHGYAVVPVAPQACIANSASGTVENAASNAPTVRSDRRHASTSPRTTGIAATSAIRASTHPGDGRCRRPRRGRRRPRHRGRRRLPPRRDRTACRHPAPRMAPPSCVRARMTRPAPSDRRMYQHHAHAVQAPHRHRFAVLDHGALRRRRTLGW